MRKKLLIWGAGGRALVVADIIHLVGEYQIVGFLDDVNPTRRNEEFCELPILGGRKQLEVLKSMNIGHIVFAFGNGEARLKLAEIVLAQGFYLATAVHPKAIITDSILIWVLVL